MTLEPGALALVLAVVALGPWGLVLVVALVRGYTLSIRLRRPPSSVAGMTQTPAPEPRPVVEGEVVPAVVPAVMPATVEPAPEVDEGKVDEAVERGKITRDE